MFRKHSLRIILVLAVMIIPAIALSPVTIAQGSISLYTAYPGIAGNPGEKITFPMWVDNEGPGSTRVELFLVEAPEGWSASFKGRGTEIHQVYVRNKEQEKFDFEVQVPEEVEPGDYRFVLEARAGNRKSVFPLVIRIMEAGEPAVRLTIDYPILSGPSGTEFKYRVNLINDSPHEQMFSLFAGVPVGWAAVFQPSYRSEQIASITLDAGATQGLDVIVKSPHLVEAGEYPIKVEAVGSLASASLELKAVITGTYDLNVTTPTGRLSARARAGEETPLTLLLENRGTAELRDVTLSATAPRNWLITFKPEKVDLIRAGEMVEVTAFIRPESKAIAGDYMATVRARSDEAFASADFRITILTPTLWGVIGVGAVVLALFAIFTVFRIYGRR